MKFGSESVPNTRLPNLIDEIKTIYNSYETKEVDHDSIAQLLKHSSKGSGTYRQKIADMRSFGLIDGRGDIRITYIGEKIADPSSINDERDSMLNALKQIPLWKNIYEKYTEKGLDFPSDFWTYLRTWSGMTPEEAKKHEEKIKNAYLEDIRLIKQRKEEIPMEKGQTAGSINTSNANPTISTMAELVKGMIITGAYDIAKQYIDYIKLEAEKE